MDTPPTVYSHCQVCLHKLEHTALFCPKCGLSACSWDCYVRHLTEHTRHALDSTSSSTLSAIASHSRSTHVES